MEKTAKCIKMLRILNTGRVYKVKELADLLETKERNVIDYKEELNFLGDEEGFHIVGIPGKFGGYQLNHTYPIPGFKFTSNEKKALTEGLGYLLKRNDFLYSKDYQSAMSKVLSAFEHESREADPLIYNRFPLTMPSEELEARYKAIELCIVKHTKVQIDYLSLKNEVTIRVFHPYKLFMYNNSWYAIGFDEKSNEIRYFKLNRIEKYTVLTQQKFRKLLYYKDSDYFDENGMKQNGEWYPIKLQLFDQYAMLVKERIYGKNQTVETQPDGSSILSCEMQNKENIKVFVLGFGEHCKVLEPEWLREEIIEGVKNIFDIYES